MSGLFVVFLTVFVAVSILYFRRRATQSKDITPRQEPSIERRDEVEEIQHVLPVVAAPAKAAQSMSTPQAAPALRGATRVSTLPRQPDYSEYDEPTYLRLKRTLSFA